MPTEELKPAIRTKRRGLLSKGIVLLCYSARPNAGANTVDTLQNTRFKELRQALYSPGHHHHHPTVISLNPYKKPYGNEDSNPMKRRKQRCIRGSQLNRRQRGYESLLVGGQGILTSKKLMRKDYNLSLLKVD